MIRRLYPKEAYIQFKAFGMAAVSLCSPADLSAAPSSSSEDAHLRALAEEFAAIEKRGYLGVEASAALTARIRDALSQECRGHDAAS